MIIKKRAKYNTITRTFDPPLEYWRKVCICDQPHNPVFILIIIGLIVYTM